MALELNFTLPEKLYKKDPQRSEYGKKLLSNAIELINELGLESFTFKKLGTKMDSSEVSIYRYFVNKHFLLLYLNCWYWEWVSYLIDSQTLNMTDARAKLKKAIHCLTHAKEESTLTSYINEELLFQIILNEGSKSYHISSVDEENKHGFYLPYKELIERIVAIIDEVNPKFKYSRSLASSLFEMINNQIFYAEHLGRLTSLKSKNTMADLQKMLEHFAFAAIDYKGGWRFFIKN